MFWIQAEGRLVDFYPQREAARIAGCHPAELFNWRTIEDGGKGQICRPLSRCIKAQKHPLEDAVFGSKWGNTLIIYQGDDLRVIEKEKKGLRQVRTAPRPPINGHRGEIDETTHPLPTPRGHVKQQILRKLWEHQVLTEDKLARTRDIARWCEGLAGDPENYKQPLATLVKGGYLESIRGPFGGFFLTPRGSKVAETLGK